MTDTSNVTNGQQEEPSYARLLREHRRELEQLRAVVLYEQSQRKLLLLDSLDEMERGLSRIIKDLDRLQSTLHIDDLLPSVDDEEASNKILLSIEKAQANVRMARQCLLAASSFLELHRPRSLRQSKEFFANFDEYTDLLGEAIEQLKI